MGLSDLIEICREKGLMITTAESCTGGMIASAITDMAGSSDVFGRGFVTYSNEAKIEMLGVPIALIAEHGAVSEPVAKAMAMGAIEHSKADIAVAVTGVAGPSGGSDEKPVGTVCIAVCKRGKEALAKYLHFTGDRAAVRQQTVETALKAVHEATA